MNMYPLHDLGIVAQLYAREPTLRLKAARATGIAFVKRARRRLYELALTDRAVVDDTCWGTVRDEARAALYALDHRRDLMWPLLQRSDIEGMNAIRKRVLTYIKDRKGPTTSAPNTQPADHASGEVSEREMLEDMLIRDDRMPIYDGRRGRFSITPDAIVFFTPKGGATQRERRPRWLIIAVEASCVKIPELAILLPERPDGAAVCTTCKGLGKVRRPWRRIGPFCDGCWGLGWTCLPEVSKRDIPPELEPEFVDSDEVDR